jgi:hypothetical protein
VKTAFPIDLTGFDFSPLLFSWEPFCPVVSEQWVIRKVFAQDVYPFLEFLPLHGVHVVRLKEELGGRFLLDLVTFFRATTVRARVRPVLIRQVEPRSTLAGKIAVDDPVALCTFRTLQSDQSGGRAHLFSFSLVRRIFFPKGDVGKSGGCLHNS